MLPSNVYKNFKTTFYNENICHTNLLICFTKKIVRIVCFCLIMLNLTLFIWNTAQRCRTKPYEHFNNDVSGCSISSLSYHILLKSINIYMEKYLNQETLMKLIKLRVVVVLHNVQIVE